MNKKIRLCLVAPVPPPYGGIGNWVLLLKKHSENNKKIEMNIIDTAPKSRGLDGRNLWDRVVVQGWQMFCKCRELIHIIKDFQPNLVHITTSGQLSLIRDIFLLKIAKKKGIPSVYHIHFGRSPEIAKKQTFEWKFMAKVMNLASVVMVIDNETYDAIRQYLPNVNVTCLPNPIDILNLPAPIDSSSKTIMFLGWVIKTKGIEELLLAWEQVYKDYDEWKLRIVGPCNDKYMNYLRSQYSFSGVIYEGEKNHEGAMKLLNLSEIFIFPSYTEGFPNAVLEAMAFSKPIIATRVGAIPDMLADGCGILIDSKAPEEIAIELRNLIDSESKRFFFGDNAYRKLCKEYTIGNVFNRYMHEWEKLSE
ncbi:D-inositol-3-phosphate glycosyltransferase [bioreactor metagenome]|uniref:D-inositol-3-phosphate glycosyltransferase n=1 Tax=bioreactor metagenome TaxID=1076179 RepID=A0A645CM78_9ZZZZ